MTQVQAALALAEQEHNQELESKQEVRSMIFAPVGSPCLQRSAAMATGL